MTRKPSIFRQFVTGYMTAALWSSTSTMPGDEDGDPVELENFEWGDGEPLKRARECAAFFYQARHLLEQYAEERSVPYGESVWAYAGHDFWLTRCRHGVGFWDRGLGELGTKLTAVSHSEGEIDLYLGDDEKVYS